MPKVGNVVQTEDGAIGMRPGIFTIEWDETTFSGTGPPRHWTKDSAAALKVLS